MPMTAMQLVGKLREKYPRHVIAICTNGKVSRRVPRRYRVGSGGRRTVIRNVLEAVYDPAFYTGMD